MRRIVFWIMPLVLVPALWGQDKPNDKLTEKKLLTPLGQLQALSREIRQAQQELLKTYEKADTDDAKEKIIEELNKLPDKFSSRFLQLAEKNPKDQAAFEALIFVAVNARAGHDANTAAQILLKDHTDRLARILPQLGEISSPTVGKLLRGFLEKSTDKDRGQATLSLAQHLKNRSESPEITPAEAEKASQEAEELFTKVVDRYAKIDQLAEQAKEELADLRTFGIGKTAPDIAGEDIDGKKFKLSDYRGKVVVLDFWGNW